MGLAGINAFADSPPTTPPSDAPTLKEQTGDPLVDVRVEGNRRVEREAIKRALKQKIGDTFDATRTAEDLRALWGLNYFSDIQLLTQHLPKGVVYVVRVTERPSIKEVKLSGNDELGKDDFKDVIDLKAFAILDLDAVRRNVKKISDKYVEKGYFLAEVTSRLDKVAGANQVDVVFVVNEHAKVLVKEINLLGAERVPADELKAIMQTKEGGFLSFITGEGTYREELFQRDLTLLTAAYYDRGFINVKIEKPNVSLSADKRFIYISIRVEEGEPYRVGKIDFSGDMLVSKTELRHAVTAQSGEFFSRSKMGKDLASLTDIYYDHGYAYANVTPVTQPATAGERVIDFTFDIQKGKQVYIEKIEVVGNTKTRDKVIRRELRVYEGELFNGTGLKRSKDRVTALGFFESVEVTHKPGSDDSHVTVQVEVKEKATGTFQVGFGFSSVEQFIFTAQISQNNFVGWGQTLSASAQVSGLRQLYQASFFDPYFLDTDFVLSADLYRTESIRPDFTRDALGGDINIGYHLFEDFIANGTYTLERVAVSSNSSSQVVPAGAFRSGTTSSVRGSLTWDKRDNRLFPTKGFMEFISAEFAPKFLGGTFNFARYTAFSRFYQPLPLGMVFKVQGNIGLLQNLATSGERLPISELYLLGGINSVRGYELASIGPCTQLPRTYDPSSSTTCFLEGGDKQLSFNFELEFPIIEKVGIRGVLFYDAGNSFARGNPFFTETQYNVPLGLFQSFGWGVRWFSPIGPLRFEWGIPLTRRYDRDTQPPPLFEFTIGNSF